MEIKIEFKIIRFGSAPGFCKTAGLSSIPSYTRLKAI